CGYEHPCQIEMKDISINTRDSNTPKSLSLIYEYDKTRIGFAGMDYLTEKSLKEEVFKIKTDALEKEAIKKDKFKNN
ncbi:MAG TPA: hypothetical protein VMZ91_11230, partial [Candidatus Paceibacterota bacterium]|nr:hypothetical protein [Candidatus Paceibacterota bacterium]